MSEIQAVSSQINSPLLPQKSLLQHIPSSSVELPSIATNLGIRISAESQYLFEIDKYLTGLDPTEQSRALEFLSQSDDLLQNKAAEYFRQNQETLKHILDGKSPVLNGKPLPEEAEALLNTGLVIDEATAVIVQPQGVAMFGLKADGDIKGVGYGGFNRALKDELDALETTAAGLLDNQDRENVFGSVRNFVTYSEHVFLSFDAILHFNYAREKAEEAIRFVTAPPEIKDSLRDILSRNIAYQNQKQTDSVEQTKKFVNNERIGHLARESLRLEMAAQNYHHQLQDILKSADVSILDAKGVMKNLLVENTDLIRFSPDKLDEAMAFYKRDYEKFERALRKDFSSPVPDAVPTLDMDILEVGGNYALKVIGEIQSYMLNR